MVWPPKTPIQRIQKNDGTRICTSIKVRTERPLPIRARNIPITGEMCIRDRLKPKTIAIVGASEKAGFGGDTTRNYLKFSKNLDRLYLVNPGRDTIFGHRAYHSLSEIEGDVDLVILCTPQKTIIPL